MQQENDFRSFLFSVFVSALCAMKRKQFSGYFSWFFFFLSSLCRIDSRYVVIKSVSRSCSVFSNQCNLSVKTLGAVDHVMNRCAPTCIDLAKNHLLEGRRFVLLHIMIVFSIRSSNCKREKKSTNDSTGLTNNMKLYKLILIMQET